MSILIQIHIGKELPDYIIDSIYQTLLIHHYSINIYMILSDSLIPIFNRDILNLSFPTNEQFEYQKLITVVPLSKLNNDEYLEYYNKVSKFKLENFRDSFWISTTTRFFYIKECYRLFLKSIKNVFHIENDIMLYYNLNDITIDKKGIYMVQDSINRVIPSIMCFSDYDEIDKLTKHIVSTVTNSEVFINDMNILAKYENLIKFDYNPFEENKIIFDGAAIGQYIGGIDYRNIQNYNIMTELNNPSINFINETCDFKVSNLKKEYKKLEHLYCPIKYYTIHDKPIVNLHIHSKQLFQFSSIFDIKYNDIISGDRVVENCDIVLTTSSIDNFHKNNFKNKIYLDREPLEPLLEALKNINKTIKIFVYTHIYKFINLELKNIVLYLHNSDDPFDTTTSQKIYAQNLDSESDNLNLLPIGIANLMWPHGNLIELYTVMKNTYKLKKTNNIYINFDVSTYSYRKEIMQKLIKNNYVISTKKNYKDYLLELSSNKYSFCIRGNGLDTHRFWESLYLGVIPIVLNDSNTKMSVFIKNLRKLGVDFIEIGSIDELNKFKVDDNIKIQVQTKDYLKISNYFSH